ncbi:MAG: SPOR domain-containing protein [Bacteroidota bacterium]
MMLRSGYLFFLMMICCGAMQAQNITINEDFEVEQIVEKFVSINTSKSYVEGWRVQVVSTTDRQKLESVRSSLKVRYPYLSTSWVHNRPYYRLRAGAFGTRLEALRLQHLLRKYYPGCIPTRDTRLSASEIIGF